ncbi:MAG TPA: CBS domain-containing protein, partial [Acidimicrobiales bacterium]|nr:CBS domain-containing protein [Acidimicrobiales bacterium]
MTGLSLAELQLDPPTRVPEHTTLRAVAAMMSSNDVSCVVVGTGCAIVTEHDLAAALASGIDGEEPVTRIATRAPVWATSSTTVVDAVGTMVGRGIRHLLVLTPNGDVLGVLPLATATRALLAPDSTGAARAGTAGHEHAEHAPSPIKRIAVGFDGSPDAEAALRWAAQLARALDAEVIVVHAVGILEYASNQGLVPGLEDAARRVAVEEGLPNTSLSFRADHGDPCSVLSRAESQPVDAD